MTRVQHVLVTGATGYVGGRLVPRLLEAGHRVRCMVRDPARLEGRDWLDEVEVTRGDVLERDSLGPAMTDIDAAYYLIHSMQGGENFHQRDLQAAQTFGKAARAGDVGRIIYLGGLGDPEAELSPHLRSRQETGATLRESGIPVTEFRAAIIVGAGSVSFEMIRYLTERLPVMICPRWVYTRVQPIAIDNVLDYLVAALEVPESSDRIVGIGGADILTYGGMMTGYAKVRGLRRYLIPVPVLTPRLSSYWVHWVTPIPASIARPLISGLRNEVVVLGNDALELFPDIVPVDYRTAVQRALEGLEAGCVETSWCDALATSQGDEAPAALTTEQGMIVERRLIDVAASQAATYRAFSGLGGEQGWLYGDVLWRLRGTLDRLVGGVGYRRGRRDAEGLRVGDALDFWRVEAVEPGKLVRLRAEMKLPGRAWLQFEARATGENRSQLAQTAFFAPKGLFGLLYWYVLYPVHRLIFARMPGAIAQRAEQLGRTA